MDSSERVLTQIALPFEEGETLPQGQAVANSSPAQEEAPALSLAYQDMMKLVVETDNMVRAYRRVKANRGAPGIDGVTTGQLAAYVKEHWVRIRQELLEGRYQPQAVRRKTIPKPTGGERLLGIPTVIDRLIQQALCQVIGPMFDPLFSESSFGFRPHRSAHDAVRQLQAYAKEGYRIAVDMDLLKFFDNVQHDKLLSRLARKVQDKHILQLVGRYLRSGVMAKGQLEPTEKGVPQGGPLSPLLSNILLDDLDKELERRGHRFARYADDLLLLVRSKKAGKRVMSSLVKWLRSKLALEVNSTKSQVAHVQECKFLGFMLRGGRIWIARQALAKVKEKVKQLTARSAGVSLEKRIKDLNAYLRGWVQYFALSQTKTWAIWLDQWSRRRLRMCLWKQWKRPRTRIRNLLALGVPKDWAITAGSSSKGPWRLSRTLNTHWGLSVQWFKSQGLISLMEQWVKLSHLRRTA